MTRIVLIFTFIFLISACTGSEEGSSKGSEQLRIAIAYAKGGKGDQSYNDSTSKVVPKLTQRGIAVQEFQPRTLSEYRPGLDLIARDRFDIVFCIGFLYDSIVEQIHIKYPSTLFVVIDGSAMAEPNLSSLKFDSRNGSFLAGIVAGEVSQSGKIAFIGGMDIPIISEFKDGFSEGAKSRNTKIEVLSYFVGASSKGFTDPVNGRVIALRAISEGADVVYHAAGSSGNGVIRAAKDKGVYAIGVDQDQSALAPETVITSMVKNIDAAILSVIDGFESDEDLGGEILTAGLKDGGVSLAEIRIDSARLTEIVSVAKKKLIE